MNWYCEHVNGSYKDIARNCAFRDKEISEGAVLGTNAGKVGAWYFDDEVDTRPTAYLGWKEVKAYACNCKCESDCPVLQARRREIDDFVNSVITQGYMSVWHTWSELNHYLTCRYNPMGSVYPRDIQLPRECAREAETLLHQWLEATDINGQPKNNKRQLA